MVWGAVAEIGYWATRDGRESLNMPMLVSWDFGGERGADVPEHLEGNGVRLLDGVDRRVALVAHLEGARFSGSI